MFHRWQHFISSHGVFLGSLLGAGQRADTYSVLSFMMMNPFAFLTLNHVTLPQSFVATPSCPRWWVPQLRLVLDMAEGGGGGWLLGGGLAVRGCGDSDWGWRWGGGVAPEPRAERLRLSHDTSPGLKAELFRVKWRVSPYREGFFPLQR